MIGPIWEGFCDCIDIEGIDSNEDDEKTFLRFSRVLYGLGNCEITRSNRNGAIFA